MPALWETPRRVAPGAGGRAQRGGAGNGIRSLGQGSLQRVFIAAKGPDSSPGSWESRLPPCLVLEGKQPGRVNGQDRAPGKKHLPARCLGSTWNQPKSHARPRWREPQSERPQLCSQDSLSPHWASASSAFLWNSSCPAGEAQPTVVGLVYIQLQHFLHASITALGTTTFKPKWGT